jgi:DNA primase
VAGLIRDEDIALVRERARIDEVVEQYVSLRTAGGGSRKGLCPFHDEKTPSFTVTPARQYWYCFGCGRGGDVISFLQEIEGLAFAEAVERLAGRVGVDLRYSEGGGPARQGERGQRQRLVEAHRIAAEFYSAQLEESPDAVAGREFLSMRGFDRQAAERFGVGFAPRAGDVLLRHLRGRNVRDEDAIAAGLVGQSARGPYDRFRGRLLWPIRELSGEVVGFGARRLFDDDRIEAKYLNTPESPIYKKSSLLYGVDLARRDIARSSQAVVVEGYTDVMACHLAGVPTAVATCGTAFGPEHTRILRRLLLDHDEFRGEVIFTFDGDEAGQRAALRAFEGDREFGGQTYVAVEPDGLDPCDLRLQKGDAAVRELVARRVPLYRFVLRNVVDRYDLDRADGRIDAVRAAARLVTSVRDRSKVSAFVRELSDMVGVDPDDVRDEIRRGGGQAASRGGRPTRPTEVDPGAATLDEVPDVREPRFADEREALKAVVQHPQLAAGVTALDSSDFGHPLLRLVWQAIMAEPLPTGGDQAWLARLAQRLPEEAQPVLAGLAVDPLPTSGEVEARYVDALLARLQEITAARRIDEVKSRLQRTNPIERELDYNRMFGELVALEQHRRQLRERAIGGGVA